VTLLSCVFPAVPSFHLDARHMDGAEQRRTWPGTSTRALVDGPVCQFQTRRIHRRDVRTVADLPWGPWRVVLHLHVRQFCCANGRCPRRMFTERLAPPVAPWAQRTQRLVRWLAHVAMAPGGRAGVRLSCALGLPISRHPRLS
jgi:transposase